MFAVVDPSVPPQVRAGKAPCYATRLFSAGGRSGRRLAEAAVRRGHEVTALAREARRVALAALALRRDTLVSVEYSEELNFTTRSATYQRTNRHGILGQKPSDFQRFL